MTRNKAIAEAEKFGRDNDIDMVVVLEGIHRDEDAPEDSHGYCPASAKATLYPYATITDEIKAQ